MNEDFVVRKIRKVIKVANGYVVDLDIQGETCSVKYSDLKRYCFNDTQKFKEFMAYVVESLCGEKDRKSGSDD